METSHRNFTEKTIDRVVASADERSSAIIARTALRRVMAESDSLYHNPTDTSWVENKINTFKDNLRSEITHNHLKNESKHIDKSAHWPDTYAKMLREELEYIELCIEYNDKTGNVPSKSKKEKSKPIKVVGHIDLSKPDSKPEWEEKKDKILNKWDKE